MLQLRKKFPVTILPVNLPVGYHRLKPIPRTNLNKIRLVILYLLPKSCSQDHHSQVKTTQHQRRFWLDIQPLPMSSHFTCPCDEHTDPFIIALQLLYPGIKLTVCSKPITIHSSHTWVDLEVLHAKNYYAQITNQILLARHLQPITNYRYSHDKGIKYWLHQLCFKFGYLIIAKWDA